MMTMKQQTLQHVMTKSAVDTTLMMVATMVGLSRETVVTIVESGLPMMADFTALSERQTEFIHRVALEAGIPMKMALRITDQERPYVDAVVRPALRKAGRQVEIVGEVGGAAKEDFIGRARAVIFASPWEEPFGLVLTEAGAHGIPVVGLRRGAAPEIVAEGVTGAPPNRPRRKWPAARW